MVCLGFGVLYFKTTFGPGFYYSYSDLKRYILFSRVYSKVGVPRSRFWQDMRIRTRELRPGQKPAGSVGVRILTLRTPKSL